MTLPRQNAIRITAPATAGAQSRVRKQFNTWVKKLEAERVKLASWHTELPKIRALFESEFRPLAQRYDVHRKQLVLALDRAYYDKTMGKKEKQKLVELICSTALDLIDNGDDDDDVIKTIYNTHSGRNFNLDMEQEQEVMRKMVARISGVELDDDADMSSPAALFEAMRQKMAERAQADQDADALNQARPDAPAKPAKLNAREARHQAEEVKLKQSVRDIFRQLASALHPDRETDPAEHTRKTVLMQRVNVAYAANDLLGLLELQLEVDQIDQSGLDNLNDERIAQYNQILAKQVHEIGFEIRAREHAFMLDMGLEPGRQRTPRAILRGLQADIKVMRDNVKFIEEDLNSFSDIRQIKRWLKDYNSAHNASPFDEPWF